MNSNTTDHKKFWQLLIALAFVLILIVLLDLFLWHMRANTAIQNSKTSLSAQDTLVPQPNATEDDKAHIFTTIQNSATATSTSVATTSLVATLKKGAQLSDEDKMQVFKSFRHK